MSDVEDLDPEIDVNVSDDEDIEEVYDGEDGTVEGEVDGEVEVDGEGEDNDGEEDENDGDEHQEQEQDTSDDEEQEQNLPFQDESTFVESMIGGAKPDDYEEEFIVDQNKKIVHHDEIMLLHPESSAHNYDEIHKASLVTRNENNIIVDKLHTSIPILTKYEMAKILGQRTKQLNEGSEAFITWDRPTIDNALIAEEELMQKKLPFIIQRPLPNGGFEYWNVKDLEVIRDM